MKIYSRLAAGFFMILWSSSFLIPFQNDKIVAGLKDALNVSSKNAVGLASKTDGYFKSPRLYIPFPPEVKDMEVKLRKAGMNKQVEEFVLSMNRAAEGAVKDALPIFGDAVKSMTVADGMSLLKGNEHAITDFFKVKTDQQLITKFRPVVSQSLAKVKAVQYWTSLQSAYNKLPLVKKKDFDITTYTTRKAVDGLFILMGDEELKIRKDPGARVTNVLKDVFGSFGPK